MTKAPWGQVTRIESRGNPLLKQVRLLSGQSTAYRKQGQFWIEGDHLCRAAMQRHATAAVAVFADSFWSAEHSAWEGAAVRTVVVPDALFGEISGLESAGRVGFVMDLPNDPTLGTGIATIILDRVQDAGNVGSIIRSAAAFGFRQVVALKGTAALWSPKVLRAGMGAHFGLDLVEGLEPAGVLALGLPLVLTSSHRGDLLHQNVLPVPCAWVFGHEGQGVCEELQSHAGHVVRIAQPGGEESLNVAAAAAICLHASAIQGASAVPASRG